MPPGPGTAPRHARRPHLPDVRPLDRLRTIKIKLGVLVGATVTLGVLIAWLGLTGDLHPLWTLPLAVGAAMAVVGLLARGMTSPLREMTAAAQAMAAGDWTRRVRATSRDEVGQLAEAFNTMAEDLAQQDALRRETVANVSHELRTPVAALQAQLENMVDGVTEPTEAALGSALAQTERLGRLVGYLLDLSRIEAGVADLHVTALPLAQFLDEAVGAVVPVAAPRGVRFEVRVTPPALTLPADGERLHQVVANLLHNAVRHSPEDGTVTVTARAEGAWVFLDVVDEGPGIAPADRRRVFERFTRGGRQGDEPATGGTGLGLAIVRWAVHLHGGTVEVVDSPVGADLQVVLPRWREATEASSEK